MSLLVSTDKEGKHLVESPEVGRFYWVTCVFSRRLDGRKNVFMPVLGDRHEDKEIIGLPVEHWHYDWRFAPKWKYEREYLHGNRVLAAVDTEHYEVRKRLRCKREELPYPPLLRRDERGPRWGPALEAKFKDAKMKCLTCPHRGLPLDPASVDMEGRVVCRGHGLRWRLSTGELVPFNDLETTANDSKPLPTMANSEV